MAHGDMDTVIPITTGFATRDALANLGFDVLWHRYDMGHTVCQQEIEDISQWISRIISAIRDAETP